MSEERITSCHHRLIHEHGWTIAGDPEGDITWHRPHGYPFEPQPTVHPLQHWKHTLDFMLPIRPPDRPAPTPYPLLR